MAQATGTGRHRACLPLMPSSSKNVSLPVCPCSAFSAGVGQQAWGKAWKLQEKCRKQSSTWKENTHSKGGKGEGAGMVNSSHRQVSAGIRQGRLGFWEGSCCSCWGMAWWSCPGIERAGLAPPVPVPLSPASHCQALHRITVSINKGREQRNMSKCQKYKGKEMKES